MNLKNQFKRQAFALKNISRNISKMNKNQYFCNIARVLSFALLTMILSFCAPSTNNGGGGDGNGNSSGGGNGGNASRMATTPSPSNVSNLRVSFSNQSSVTFNWSNPTASATETFAGVYVQGMSGTTAPANCNSRTAPTSGTRGTSHTINGLAEGTRYSIRVCSHTSGANPTISNGVTVTGRAIISGCPGAVGSLVNTSIASRGIHPTRILDGRAGATTSYTININPSAASNYNELGTVDYAFMFCGVSSSSINGIEHISSPARTSGISSISALFYYQGVRVLSDDANLTTSVLNTRNPFSPALSNSRVFNSSIGNLAFIITEGTFNSRYWGRFTEAGAAAVFPSATSAASVLRPQNIMLNISLVRR